MPVILPIGYEKDWIKDTLSLTQVLRMLNQFDSKKMNAYPVSDKINEPNENGIFLITPTEEKIQNEMQSIPKISTNNHYWHKKKPIQENHWGK